MRSITYEENKQHMTQEIFDALNGVVNDKSVFALHNDMRF